MNDQRKVIYDQRIEMMTAENVSDTIAAMRTEINDELVGNFVPKRSYPEQWDMEGLEKEVFRIYGLHTPLKDWAKEEGIADEEILERLQKITGEQMAHKVTQYGNEIMSMAEKRVLLQTLDQLWKDHLLSLDHLRHGINLRAYGQRDPLNEYKQEAFSLFEQMLSQLREQVTSRMAHLEIQMERPMPTLEQMQRAQKMQEGRSDPALTQAQQETIEISHAPLRTHVSPQNRDPNDPATWGKVARNDFCPCGSGKKYKHCHGAIV
jgi:preprotein translocase subunit SecA